MELGYMYTTILMVGAGFVTINATAALIVATLNIVLDFFAR
jgi:hypothetical protein